MNVRVLAAAAAAVGTAAVLAWRRKRRTASEAKLWADATDPVSRFGS